MGCLLKMSVTRLLPTPTGTHTVCRHGIYVSFQHTLLMFPISLPIPVFRILRKSATSLAISREECTTPGDAPQRGLERIFAHLPCAVVEDGTFV